MSVFQDCLDSYLKSNNVQISEDEQGMLELRKKNIEENGRKKKVSGQIQEITKNNNICFTGSSEKNKLCMKYQGNFKIIKF